MKVNESDFIEMTKSEKMTFLAQSVAPGIVSVMISNGIIDVLKIDDVEYLRSVFSDNLRETIQGIDIITELDDDFIMMAEVAIDKGKYLPAIVLIATAIEHKINVFYRWTLVSEEVSNEDITSIIRRVDFRSKITWLMRLSVGIEIPEDLKKLIFSVVELRNSIVHYKAVPSNIDDTNQKDSYGRIVAGLDGIDIEMALRIPVDLDSIFESWLRENSEGATLSRRIIEILEKSK